MKTLLVPTLAGALSLAAPSLARAQDGSQTPSAPPALSGLADPQARSIALFEEMRKVLTHPRCMNCHPVDGGPRQGMAMAPHNPPVVRGEADFGAPGMQCSTCHGEQNVGYAAGPGSIPGHEPWHLAPKSMGWIGLSLGQICKQLKDPERNGGRSLDELHEHNAKDGLVGWGWKPGEGREPVPGTQALFGELTRAWIDTGAHCPSG